ncbi:acyl carrier protein [Streptomyces shenzhenensis]|uniref:Carrier domain-containing protein n=1 Tax=Streptomyces shenzhenensis TaxID=943815 RepID=A0A3M0HVS8_9ACTN|nr:acyl carrier protein [Streptomyces shenzhenensis]RMB80130.1 hypothetical protein CTZ28_42045 [Streptomyces shenzhenensis]
MAAARQHQTAPGSLKTAASAPGAPTRSGGPEHSLTAQVLGADAHKFQVGPTAIADANTLTDLGLDSLAVVELIGFLAADLGLQLQDDTLHPAMTVDEAVAVLRQGSAKS